MARGLNDEVTLDELARRAAEGDREALSALVRRLQHPMYRLALRFLGHPEDAQAACQEILRRVGPLTNESVFPLDALPRRLAVVGGGAIGCEMAQAFARLGSAVTVIEAEDRLLPREEPEVSHVIAAALATDGVAVCTDTALERAEVLDAAGGARLHLDSGSVMDADRVLVAVGRHPATGGLGLAEIGVAVDERGHVRTDATLATTVKGIWAIGDVTGRMPFTHAAARMGFVAAHNALAGRRHRRQRFDPTPIPWVTFTAPEVGRVGMTEADASERGGGSPTCHSMPLTGPSPPARPAGSSSSSPPPAVS